MNKPFCGSYSGGRVTPDLVDTLNYTSNAVWNETFWKRPAFDRLVEKARSELDAAKRRQLYAEAQTMLAEDGGAIIPMFNNFIDVGSAKVKGFTPSPFIEMGGGRAAEQVWLAS
jgi:peptide/nickel transport system substrate-binding protein